MPLFKHIMARKSHKVWKLEVEWKCLLTFRGSRVEHAFSLKFTIGLWEEAVMKQQMWNKYSSDTKWPMKDCWYLLKRNPWNCIQVGGRSHCLKNMFKSRQSSCSPKCYLICCVLDKHKHRRKPIEINKIPGYDRWLEDYCPEFSYQCRKSLLCVLIMLRTSEKEQWNACAQARVFFRRHRSWISHITLSKTTHPYYVLYKDNTYKWTL